MLESLARTSVDQTHVLLADYAILRGLDDIFLVMVDLGEPKDSRIAVTEGTNSSILPSQHSNLKPSRDGCATRPVSDEREDAHPWINIFHLRDHMTAGLNIYPARDHHRHHCIRSTNSKRTVEIPVICAPIPP